MEPMRRIRVDHDFPRLARGVGLGFRRAHSINGDALILASIEAENRTLQLVDVIRHGCRLYRRRLPTYWSIPGDGCFQVWILLSIEPGHSPASAEACNAQPVGVPLVRCRPGDGGIVIGHVQRVWCARDYVADDLLNVGHFRKVTETGIILGGDGQISLLGEATAGILDILVDTEDFL